MKIVLLTVLVAMAVSVLPVMAMDDIEITAARKKLDSSKDNPMAGIMTQEKSIIYVATVENTAFKPLENVTVKYNIFYEDVELGSTAKPVVKSIKGARAFASIPRSDKVEFDTDPITLGNDSVGGNYYFANGGESRARDKVVGVWFKAFDSAGKMIGEYANPSTVPKKQTWKD